MESEWSLDSQQLLVRSVGGKDTSKCGKDEVGHSDTSVLEGVPLMIVAVVYGIGSHRYQQLGGL